MDKNSLTGLILIAVMMIAYYVFVVPPPPPPEPPSQEQTSESIEQINEDSSTITEQQLTTTNPVSNDSDSIRESELKDRYSDFYLLTEGEEETVKVVTDELTVNINTKGGAIQSTFLNNTQTFDSLTLPIIADYPGNKFMFQFAYKGGRVIRSDDLFFTPSVKTLTVNGEDSKELTLTAKIDENRSIEQIYTFRGATYDFDYEIRFNGFKDDLKNSFYELIWEAHLPKTEMSIKNMRQKSMIAYRQGSDVEKFSPSDEVESESLKTPIKWVSYKSQFFSAILIAENEFDSGNLTMQTPENEEVNRIMESTLFVEAKRTNEISNRFTFYMGPNEYSTLNSYDLGLQKSMDLGWWIISYINIATVYAFKFLETFISNYGIIIIVLAIAIRLLLFPLSYKSHVSMAKMKVINNTPEMKALDEKYKGDAQKLQMAKMGIYREMGVSMFGGCLPMLFSYPFLIALFFFFPQSVELRQQSFLWAHDLSTYDSIISWNAQIPLISSFYGNHVSLFTLLMAASTFVFTYFQQSSQPATGGPAAQMKYIAYFMPIMLLVFLNSYAAGLSLYYLVSNVISITQTLLIRKFVDDEKLLEQMRAAAKSKKGKKGGKAKASKSRLEKWVDNQQKKQQEMMKQRQKQQKGSNRRTKRK